MTARNNKSPLVEVSNLSAKFLVGQRGFFGPRRTLTAVNDISFSIGHNQTLGLVGESGSGKTTTGRLVLNLQRPSNGRVMFGGQDISKTIDEDREAWRLLRREMQIVFQDPYQSFNPRMTVGDQVAEVIVTHKIAASKAALGLVAELFDSVGLAVNFADRFPHQLSGGQLQRALIARALAPNPRFIVLDEAVSALDVSVQAQVINLLQKLKQERGLTYLFISHNLAVTKHVSDVVAVMYLGGIVEIGPRKSLFSLRSHPYTKALIAAVPEPGRSALKVETRGDPPSSIDPPSGCTFHPRCPFADARCRAEVPKLRKAASEHLTACHHFERLL